MSERACGDCGMDVHKIGEYAYMVSDALWRRFGNGEGVLCVACLEQRIGRRLTREDFPASVPLNLLRFAPHSGRLRRRMA